MKKSELFFNVLRLPVDLLMLLTAGFATYFLRTEILSAFRPVLFEFNLPFARYLYLVISVSFIFLAFYAISGLYSLKIRRGLFDELLKITVASSAGIMIVIIYIFLRQELFDSRFLVLGGWFFAIVCVFLGRICIRVLQRHMISRFDFGTHKVLIVGDDAVTQQITEEISLNPLLGYRVVHQLAEPDGKMLKAVLAVDVVDEVLLTNPNYPAKNVVELVDFCHENHIVFKYVPNIYQTLTTNFDMDILRGLPFIELKCTALDGWGKVIKRVVDVLSAIMGLILFSPLFALLAVLIKLDTPGPAFVHLKRISKNKAFSLIKFRSMVENAEQLKASLVDFNERSDGPLFKIKNDPRVTKIGRFLRRYRIDELPQFWNIFRGDISLVGPRPHQPDEIARYQKRHKKVLAIKAGATGFAQVSGSSDLPFEQEVALDTFYIENWTFEMDIKIILKTIFKIFTDRSAV